MHRPDYILYSDGNSDIEADAGSACILIARPTLSRVKINAYLGPATNSEAELIGGILGLALCHSYTRVNKTQLNSLEWVCDNLGVLEGVSTQLELWRENGWLTTTGEPLRHQGLWQVFDALSSGINIKPRFVNRNSAPALQRSCDKAARWAQRKGKVLLRRHGEGPLGRLSKSQPANAWHLIDLRGCIESWRSANTDTNLLIERLITLNLDFSPSS